jgi:hypothetical protein
MLHGCCDRTELHHRCADKAAEIDGQLLDKILLTLPFACAGDILRHTHRAILTPAMNVGTFLTRLEDRVGTLRGRELRIDEALTFTDTLFHIGAVSAVLPGNAHDLLAWRAIFEQTLVHKPDVSYLKWADGLCRRIQTMAAENGCWIYAAVMTTILTECVAQATKELP